MVNGSGGTLNISNSTFANNSSTSGSGGLLNGSGGTLNIKNSIVANNSGGNCIGKITDQGYNLESGTDCGFTASTDLQNTNPQLASSLASNGGPTQTLALLQNSPAIDRIPVANCPATDQRGVTRPDNSETTCDLGAYEFTDTAPSPDTDLGLTGLPANITTKATSAQGAVVTYTSPTATDEPGDNPVATVSCSPASGTTFPIGTTTVTCTASDSDDTPSTVSGTFTVTVQPASPAITVTGATIHATEGSSFSGVVATGTAPANDTLSASITWGDNTPATSGTVTLNSNGTFTVSGTHTYAEEGTYTLSITVTDSNGSVSGSGSAQVADAPLTVTNFVAASVPFTTNAAVAATFTDADPAGQVSDYTATISWGDGTTSTPTLAANPLGGFAVAGLHHYAAHGTYTLTLTVTDAGGSTITRSATLTV